MRIVLWALAYFAAMFAGAFVLGTVRTLWVEPALGKTGAVACETPFLIAWMYVSARFALGRLRPARTPRTLISIGALAAVFQQVAEFGLALLSGQSVEQHLVYLISAPGLIYLAALVVFALMPLLALRKE